MIGELRPYSEYKSSGLTWCPRIPLHWDIRRIKSLLHEVDRRSANGRETLLSMTKQRGLVPYKDRTEKVHSARTLIGYKICYVGEIVMNRMQAWSGMFHVASEEGIVSPDYAVFSPLGDVSTVFLGHLLRSPQMVAKFHTESKGIGSGFLRLYGDRLGAIHTVLPPQHEQKRIVSFIAQRNRQINLFIRNRQRLIDVLNEQKQAIINQAVTRGLDPDAPLKPSGIDWLGDIPKHWELRRIRTLVTRIDQGVSPQAENLLAKDGGYGVLKSGCVNHGVFRPEQHKRLPDAYQFDRKIEVSPGDILVSRACGSPHLVGSVGQVTKSAYKLILSDKTFRLLFRSSEHEGFFLYAMNSAIYRRQVRLAISGAEGLANNLPLSSLRNFVIPFPPADEAQQIVDVVRMECNDALRGIKLAQREIDLIREYRSRLISDVVTGKVDVRHLAPPPGGEDLEDLAEALEPLDDVIGDVEKDDGEDVNGAD